VLDASRHQVISFDADRPPPVDGRWAGRGPGELQFPLAFSVSPDGVSHVFDPSKTGFVRWDADGEPLPDLRSEIPFFGGRLVVLGDGVAFDGQGRAADPSTLRSELAYTEWEGDPGALAAMDVPVQGPIAYAGCPIDGDRAASGAGAGDRLGRRWRSRGAQPAAPVRHPPGRGRRDPADPAT
jgi:hypothetical protein